MENSKSGPRTQKTTGGTSKIRVSPESILEVTKVDSDATGLNSRATRGCGTSVDSGGTGVDYGANRADYDGSRAVSSGVVKDHSI